MALWSFSGSFIISRKNYASKCEYCRIIHEKTTRTLFDLRRPRGFFSRPQNSLSLRRTVFQCNLRNVYIKDSIRVQLPVLKLGKCFYLYIFPITQVSFLIQKCSTHTGLNLPVITYGTTSTTLKESM